MKRETELLLGRFKAEVKDILMNFDKIINGKLEDTVTITTGSKAVKRKATLQDTVELYKNEWSNVIESLDDIGVNLESNKVSFINTKTNHKAIYKELEEYANKAYENGHTSFLEYRNIQIPYKNIYMEDDITGGTTIIPYFGDNIDESGIAIILLDKNTEYEVIDKTGSGEHPLLIEK